MRYGDGGGVNQAGRARREQVRRQAADLFAQGVTPVEVAKRLEVSQKSAYLWRRAWHSGGVPALASKGAPGPEPTLSDAQLARVSALIGLMFKVRVGITTAWEAMRRLGYSPQLPTRRAIERNEQAIARWRRYQWPAVKESRAG